MKEISLFKNITNGIEVREIEEERKVELKLPSTSSLKKCMFIFEKYKNISYNKTFFAKINNGIVGGSGDFGPTIGTIGNVYNDIVPYPMEGINCFGKPSRFFNETSYVAAQKWSGGNYFHWLVTSFPKILFGIKHGELDRCNSIVINSQGAKFVQETLEMIGNKKKIYTLDSCNLMRFSKIICPSSVGFGAEASDTGASLVKDSFSKYISDKNGKKILIKRTKDRIIENYDDVFNVLKKYGFEEVCCDGLSVKKQVEIFSQSSFVVSPHGAAETNMIFMKPGSVFIELFSPKYMGLCYYYLATSLKLNYYYIVGEGETAINVNDNFWWSANRDNMRINTKELIEVLEMSGV